jgi:hypothetical protein
MRLRLAVLLLGLLATFAPILPGHAHADEGTELKDFMHSDYYEGMVQHALAALPADVFRECPGLVSDTSEVNVLRPVTFEPNGFPASGFWRHSFPVSGCGNDTTVNLYFLALPGQRINVLIGVPGATITDLVAQREAKKFAVKAARAASKSCAAFDVTNTRFDGFGAAPPGAPGGGHAWRETWSLAGCGQRYDVPIQFLPGKTGMQIAVPAAAVPLP